MSAAAPKLFISYRREETAGHAGRLYDAVAARFGPDNVFMDVELEPGIDFVEQITTAVGDCRALLVVIGPRWASVPAPGGSGQSRLAEDDDYVRLEVETALRRADVRVIPVLVAGARMPQPEQLPDTLRALARRNAIELSDGRWRFDVGRLVDALDRTIAPEPVLAPTPRSSAEIVADPGARTASVRRPGAPAVRTLPPSARLLGEGVFVAVVAALLAYWLAVRFDRGVDFHDGDAALIVRRGMTWAPVGAALAGWLTLRRGESQLLPSRLLLGLAAGALAGVLDGLVAAKLPEALGTQGGDGFQVAAIAVAGAVIGLLLGALWRPRHPWAGLLAGALAVALAQLLLNATRGDGGSSRGGEAHDYLSVAVQSAVMVAAVLAALWAASARGDVSRAPPRES